MGHRDSSSSVLSIDTDTIAPPLLGEARRIWLGRVKSEYRSIQVMTQLLSEVLAVGADHTTRCVLAEMVADEVRHVALCAAVCQALGATPPDAAAIAAPLPPLDAVPATERVLASAISMLLINECFSVAYIRDLAARCQHPVLAPVIRQIGGDEDEHEAFAEAFVAQRLALESAPRRGGWRTFAAKLVDKRPGYGAAGAAGGAPRRTFVGRLSGAAARRLGAYQSGPHGLVNRTCVGTLPWRHASPG